MFSTGTTNTVVNSFPERNGMRAEVSARKLIFGAGGRLGTALCRLLGDDVDGCVAKPREAVDVTNARAVEQVISNCMPEVVVNLAATHAARVTDATDMWRVNVQGAMNVLTACGKLGVPLIQLSTGDVFGGFFEKKAFLECDGGYAQAPYLQTRLAAEHALLARLRCFGTDYWRSGFRFWLLRSSLLFDRPSSVSRGFVHDMAGRLVDKRETIELPADCVRCPTYVPWLAGELQWLLGKWKEIPQGIYHVCSSGEASLFDVVDYISRRVSCRGRVATTTYSRYTEQLGLLPGALAKHVPLCNDKWQSIRGLEAPTWQQQLEMYFQQARKDTP